MEHPRNKAMHDYYARINVNKGRRIRCMETGEVFDTLSECSRRFGGNPSYIRRLIRENRSTWDGKLHFEYLSYGT